MNLEQIKEDLLHKAAVADVAKGERSRLDEGMRNIPVKKMIDAVNFIDKNLLPAVKRKSGDKSEDYKFFTEVVDYLLWAIVLEDRYKQMEMRWVRQKLEIQLLQEHREMLERELQKYSTLEDLLLSSTLDVYAKRIKERAEDLLKGSTKIT